MSSDEIDRWLARVFKEGDEDRKYILGTLYQVARNGGTSPERARELAEEALSKAVVPVLRRRGIPGRFDSPVHLRRYVTQRAVRYLQRRMEKDRRERSNWTPPEEAEQDQEMPTEEIGPSVLDGRRQTPHAGQGAAGAARDAIPADEGAIISQCWDNLDPRGRDLLKDKYSNRLPDEYRDTGPDDCGYKLKYDEMAEKYLPHDGRSIDARRSDMVRQVREAKQRFWRCLNDHGVDPRSWGCRE
jgi:hypothetical protein